MLRNTITFNEEFQFEAGGSLPSLTVVYHCSERDYKPGDRVVWICHALTANSDVEDWWPDMCGEGKIFDPSKDFVICVNMLASPYGSSSPSSIDPQTGSPYYFSFPKVTVRDVIKATVMLRRALGIESVDLLVGSSVGGFQAVEWAVMEPDVIKNAIFIATAPRVPAYLTAYNEAQRMAMEADHTLREAHSLKGGSAGLEAARAIALISYRSYDGYELTQTDEDPDTLFATRACTYERYQGKKLSNRFDAYSYWYLCDMLDSHNVGRGRGGVSAALATIKAKTAVVVIDSDALFPPSMMKGMADAIPGASFHQFSSRFGHDGFLLEHEELSLIIKKEFGI